MRDENHELDVLLGPMDGFKRNLKEVSRTLGASSDVIPGSPTRNQAAPCAAARTISSCLCSSWSRTRTETSRTKFHWLITSPLVLIVLDPEPVEREFTMGMLEVVNDDLLIGEEQGAARRDNDSEAD